jgi:hypothetical protein
MSNKQKEDNFLKLFWFIDEYKLRPDAIYMLICMDRKILPGLINTNQTLRELQNSGYIEENIKISSKGEMLISEVKKLLGAGDKKDYVSRIDEYNLLFPRIKLGSGKYARTNSKTLELSFKWFFNTYPYTWDVVIEATKMYIDEYTQKNYKYMRTSQYFIRKQDVNKSYTSDLADYCEMVVNDVEDESQDTFVDKVV